MKIEGKDLVNLKNFIKILKKGDFTVKGEAVLSVALHFKFIEELEKRMEEDLLEQHKKEKK